MTNCEGLPITGQDNHFRGEVGIVHLFHQKPQGGKFVKMMKQKILEFLKTDDEDYFAFIKTLSDKHVNPFYNTEKKAGFKEYWYPRQYMSKVTGKDLNILFNVKEIDFTRFSWTFVKIHSKDSELLEIVKIINEFNDELDDPQLQFRIKRLRIHIFTTMNYVNSPFFDVETYKKCIVDMYEAMRKLNTYLAGKVKIISTTYDSVAFLGDVDYDELRKYLVPADFKVRYYDMMIRFRNLLGVKYKGSNWKLKRINGTNYDKEKEEVINFLKELKYSEAIVYLNKCDLNPKTKAAYIKDVVAAWKCPKCGQKTISPCVGGTSQVPNPRINWICNSCTHEW